MYHNSALRIGGSVKCGHHCNRISEVACLGSSVAIVTFPPLTSSHWGEAKSSSCPAAFSCAYCSGVGDWGRPCPSKPCRHCCAFHRSGSAPAAPSSLPPESPQSPRSRQRHRPADRRHGSSTPSPQPQRGLCGHRIHVRSFANTLGHHLVQRNLPGTARLDPLARHQARHPKIFSTGLSIPFVASVRNPSK